MSDMTENSNGRAANQPIAPVKIAKKPIAASDSMWLIKMRFSSVMSGATETNFAEHVRSVVSPNYCQDILLHAVSSSIVSITTA